MLPVRADIRQAPATPAEAISLLRMGEVTVDITEAADSTWVLEDTAGIPTAHIRTVGMLTTRAMRITTMGTTPDIPMRPPRRRLPAAKVRTTNTATPYRVATAIPTNRDIPRNSRITIPISSRIRHSNSTRNLRNSMRNLSSTMVDEVELAVAGTGTVRAWVN